MDTPAVLQAVPLGLAVFVLVLLPVATGLLVYGLRARVFRKGFVVAAAWALTIAAGILFLQGAFQWSTGNREPVLYDPRPLGPLSWHLLVALADIALLVAIVLIGVQRRSPTVIALGIAQLGLVAWLEFSGNGASTHAAAFCLDWLSIVMVLIVSVIGSIIAVYALPYMRQHEAPLHLDERHSNRPRFFLVLLSFLGAMNGLVLANNLLWLYFFWEVTTLCSYLLIGHDRTEEANQNALRALWMNMLGGLAFVVGIVLIRESLSTVSVFEVVRSAGHGGVAVTVLAAMACLCVAGFTKAAQMPFHTWLLGAMVAPTPVSALLHSSTMVKAGVYLIVRFAPVFYGTHLSDAVAMAGAFTFFMGALLAIGQSNAKKVLAYSTVSNLGLIIACAGLNTPLAMAAAVMLILFHAVSKGLLFMATGVVEHTIHSRDIEDMQGLVGRMPLTTVLMVLGILSMLLPPFGVLIAKLAAIESSVHLPPVMVVLVLGSTLTVVFWVKWIGRLLSVDPVDGYPKIERLHNMYFGPLLLLTAGAVVFSLMVVPILTRLVDPAVTQYYAAIFPTVKGGQLSGDVLRVPWALLFIALSAAAVAPLVFFRVHNEHVASAYLCGEQVDKEDAVQFRTVAEQPSPLVVSGFYFGKLASEQYHTRWMTIAASVLLLSLFGTVYLWR